MQDERLIRVAREKDKILELFRNKGMRITKQRKLILDIVFEQECTSCKEIYYQASKRDKNIGIATISDAYSLSSGSFFTGTEEWIPCHLEESERSGIHR